MFSYDQAVEQLGYYRPSQCLVHAIWIPVPTSHQTAWNLLDSDSKDDSTGLSQPSDWDGWHRWE